MMVKFDCETLDAESARRQVTLIKQGAWSGAASRQIHAHGRPASLPRTQDHHVVLKYAG